jgi:dTDP-4-amino-4,6-dideoxygalactose transaminase
LKNSYKTNLALIEQPLKISSPIDLNERRNKLANDQIPLNKPYLPHFSKYKKYLGKMYDNVWLTNNGPLLKELTSRLENHLGVKNLLLTSSGTMALQIAYKALKLSGNVVTTPYSFVATSSSIDWLGLGLNFADIDAKSYNLCPNNATKAINKDTSAIVPVHVYGNPCDVESFERLANAKNVKIIYDAAHAFGVKINGRSILTYGDASILSLHATKLFHSIEGGAIVFNNEEDLKCASQMINFGINYSDGEINTAGVNGKMSEAHAAMGLAMLDDIDEILERRLEHYQLYKRLLSNDITLPLWHSDASQNAAYFPVTFESESQCSRIFNELEKNNIQSRRYFSPSLNSVKHLTKGIAMPCPNSEDIATRTLCLPLFVELRKNEIAKICRVINSSL